MASVEARGQLVKMGSERLLPELEDKNEKIIYARPGIDAGGHFDD